MITNLTEQLRRDEGERLAVYSDARRREPFGRVAAFSIGQPS